MSWSSKASKPERPNLPQHTPPSERRGTGFSLSIPSKARTRCPKCRHRCIENKRLPPPYLRTRAQIPPRRAHVARLPLSFGSKDFVIQFASHAVLAL